MRMKFPVAVMCAGLAWLAMARPASAHHAFAAEYDGTKPIKLRGTVIMMEWINPHSWIHIEVKNSDGTISKWMIEAGAPNSLIRRGWNKNSLLPGTEIWSKDSRRRTASCGPMDGMSRSATAARCSSARPAPVRQTNAPSGKRSRMAVVLA